MVAVTAPAPGSVARNPEELADKLARFAAAESAKHGVEFGSHAITSPDPAIDLDERLGREAHEIGADLIVMGSHRSEEHTSELQSLMRISYAVFCLTKKKLNLICN